MHDGSLRRLYVAIGEPDVICVVETERLELVATIPTERDAHTIGLNPDDHTIYGFPPASEGAAVYADR